MAGVSGEQLVNGRNRRGLRIAMAAPLLALWCVAFERAHADVAAMLPDYYGEPGSNPFRDKVQSNVNEYIDPFTGALTLSHVDLVVPGNGGLDIRIQRTYNSNNVFKTRPSSTSVGYHPTEFLPRTTTGLGWSLHFGRVVRSLNSSIPAGGNVCSQPPGLQDTLDNPVLELPDGSMQPLLVDATAYGADYVTKQQWVAYCLGQTANSGILVISPDGTKYTMERYIEGNADVYEARLSRAWYTTRIEDRNGNWLDIVYADDMPASGINVAFSRIDASDGRVVQFQYYDPTSPGNIRLRSITANGQTWTYNYQAVSGYTGYFQLTSVQPPAGNAWRYAYNPAASDVNPNEHLLHTMTYPYGATTTYAYGYKCFRPVCGPSAPTNADGFFAIVVNTKDNAGRDVQAGRWSYAYDPSNTGDVTTVTLPGNKGRYVYRHFGLKMVNFTTLPDSQNLWRIGLLREREYYTGGSLTERETFDWQPLYTISTEDYVHPPYDGRTNVKIYDPSVIVPVLVKRTLVRDGATYTTSMSDWDSSYNPRRITESGQLSRNIDLTYFPRVARQNIVRLVKDERLVGESEGKHVLRTFDANGNLTTLTKHGVVETYSYFSSGDLRTRTNERNFTWTYADYFRGIARQVTEPEGVSISRVVNPSGTVASETDGRRNTTSYGYDGLNRVTSVRRPLGSGIGINWGTSTKTTTRGNFSHTVTFDGFGRPSLVNMEGMFVDIDYDVLGFKSFESYPASSASAIGTSYVNDVLGRPTRISNGDGTSRAISYDYNRVTETNERGFTTVRAFESYGSPDEKWLDSITDPSGTTDFSRNVLGQLLTVTKGGVTRSYVYRPEDNFLIEERHPETGTTVYGRDSVGNMTTRRVGSSNTTSYIYDGRNRLQSIDYPSPTPDESFNYNANDLVEEAAAGNVMRAYRYDANDNLEHESLTVAGQLYSVDYGYNALDHLSSIRYPSNRPSITLAPNDLGQPTQIGDYVSNVRYHPNGIPNTYVYANGISSTYDLNNRQWIRTIDVGNSIVALTYNYDGRGNVTSITNRADREFDIDPMVYDGVDRLTNARGFWGSGSIDYTTTGDILRKAMGSEVLDYNYSTSHRLSSVSGAKAYNFSYDFYGNVVSNNYHLFDYDDAGNLRSLSGNSTATYEYDANHRRARRSRNGVDTVLFYSQSGDLLGEYEPAGKFKEYFYLQGKLVAQLSVNPNNVPPSAQGGADIEVPEGGEAVLSATASSDPDGSIVRYTWRQIAGRAAIISGQNTNTLRIVAPAVSADSVLTFELTVSDNDDAVATDTVNVTVRNGYIANIPPTANAGLDGGVAEGGSGALNGLRSQDTDGVITAFAWEQIAGEKSVVLQNANTAQPTFTAPAVSKNIILTFRLTVTDDSGAQTQDDVNVTVSNGSIANIKPVANAGSDSRRGQGAPIYLSGSSSSDADGAIVAYAWTQVGGTPVTLTGANSANPSFMPPPVSGADVVLTFELQVTDDSSETAAARVNITVGSHVDPIVYLPAILDLLLDEPAPAPSAP